MQIHEKEEDEMNEKNENASYVSEEPLVTADQVMVSTMLIPVNTKHWPMKSKS